MIIGLTGNIGAGKGSVADILIKEGFEFYSLSDVIRNELKEEGIEITRENITTTAKKLRLNGGPGVFAEKLIPLLKKNKDYVIDSFRHPDEVKRFRETFKDFIFIDVDAPIEVCLQRIVKRNRENDPKTMEELKAQLDKENNDNNQQLQKTRDLADKIIINDSTLDKLKEKILILIKK